MENVRKHLDVRVVHTKKKLKKMTAKSTFKGCRIFNKDLVGVELNRRKVTLNKPSYCGMVILDLSKHLMYDFYYNHLKKLYGNRMQLQMTDTDSFLFYVETDNIFEDMKGYLHLYDTSDFPKSRYLYSLENKKALGKMK